MLLDDEKAFICINKEQIVIIKKLFYYKLDYHEISVVWIKGKKKNESKPAGLVL